MLPISTRGRQLIGGARRSSSDADALALIAQMTGSPDATRKALINTCVVALKNAGVWAKCDSIAMLAALTSHDALLDWKNPTGTAFAVANSPTFTTDRGFTGQTTSSLAGPANLDTLTLYQQDSAHAAVWQLNDEVTVNNALSTTGAAQLLLQPKFAANFAQYAINSATGTIWNKGSAIAANSFWVLDRKDASNQQLFQNGAQVKTGAAASAVRVSTKPKLFDDSNTSQIAFLSVGASLDSGSLQSDFYNAVLAYLQGVGAA